MLSTTDQSTRTIHLAYITRAVRQVARYARVEEAGEAIVVSVARAAQRAPVAARMRGMGFGAIFWMADGDLWIGRVQRARELPQDRYDRLFSALG